MTWFLTSRMGRSMASAGAFLLLLLTFGASQRRKGRERAETKAQAARIKTMETAKGVRDEIQGMDDTRVGAELDQWMRDAHNE